MKTDEDLHTRLDELGPEAEQHGLDCECETCTEFLNIMDELARRDKVKQRTTYAAPVARKREVRSFRS